MASREAEQSTFVLLATVVFLSTQEGSHLWMGSGPPSLPLVGTPKEHTELEKETLMAKMYEELYSTRVFPLVNGGVVDERDGDSTSELKKMESFVDQLENSAHVTHSPPTKSPASLSPLSLSPASQSPPSRSPRGHSPVEPSPLVQSQAAHFPKSTGQSSSDDAHKKSEASPHVHFGVPDPEEGTYC